MTPVEEWSSESLDDFNAALIGLADRYEQTDPAHTATQAARLAEDAAVVAERGVSSQAGLDWSALIARLLLLEANGLVDSGHGEQANRVTHRAETVAARIRDWPTVAHAFAIRALWARTESRWEDALDAARQGLTYAGHSPVAAMLAGGEASALASLGDRESAIDTLGEAHRLMMALPSEDHGRLGYSLDAYHPALFATVASAVLVRLEALDAAAPHLLEARESVERAGATGLRSSVRFAEAEAAFVRHDLDAAEMSTTDAVAVALAAGRPARWIVDAVTTLAARARIYGQDWSGLVSSAEGV
ncbi:MAG: hypothetical protein ACQSGP_04345 [Frankia sp.]